MADFVFLHGGGQGGWVWDETIAALRAQSGGAARALTIDIPGCGQKRGRDTSALTFDAIVAELIADIEAAGFRDALLVGHSQAGTVLPRLAKARPDLFSGLVFASCSGPEQGHNIFDMTSRLHGAEAMIALADETVPIADRFRPMFCNDMTPDSAETFLAKLGYDVWPQVAYTERDWPYDHLAALPVTFVHCLQDVILPPKAQDEYARRFHARRVVRIDAGHQLMNTRPQALAEVLLVESANPPPKNS